MPRTSILCAKSNVHSNSFCMDGWSADPRDWGRGGQNDGGNLPPRRVLQATKHLVAMQSRYHHAREDETWLQLQSFAQATEAVIRTVGTCPRQRPRPMHNLRHHRRSQRHPTRLGGTIVTTYHQCGYDRSGSRIGHRCPDQGTCIRCHSPNPTMTAELNASASLKPPSSATVALTPPTFEDAPPLAPPAGLATGTLWSTWTAQHSRTDQRQKDTKPASPAPTTPEMHDGGTPAMSPTPQSEPTTATTATPERPISTLWKVNWTARRPDRSPTAHPPGMKKHQRTRSTNLKKDYPTLPWAAAWLAPALNHEESAILSDRLIHRARHFGKPRHTARMQPT